MKENGFDYVDLGLPSGTMWATCNVGATKPEDEGLLFQFGRVDGYRFGDTNHKFRLNKQNKQDTGDEFIPKTASGKLYGKNDILSLIIILKQLLSDVVTDGDESYEFNWVGKKASIVEANKAIRKTLRPCVESSVNWEETENLYIEGDNLLLIDLNKEV